MKDDFDTLPENVTDFRWSIHDQSQISPSWSFDDDPVAVLVPGKTIPGTSWIIRRILGQGGVGEVFEVEHQLLQRRAAIKVLHAQNGLRRGLAERMHDEGRLLGLMRHPNIVDVFDMGALRDSRPYLVLELLDGRDLRAELNRLGVLSVPAALDIATQILAGLSALHRANVVHRDIKLENLFLCADGQVKILDLGAAVDIGEEKGERGPSLGTPRTMAPEQYEGKPVDERTDIYALGIVLYELLTGRGPFDDVSGLDALRFAHCHRQPDAPSRMAPQFIPPEIDALVLRALAKLPNDRFSSADALLAEIAILRDRSTPRDATSLVYEAATNLPMMRRSFASPLWSMSIALLALLVATLALGVAAGRKLPHRDVEVGYLA